MKIIDVPVTEFRQAWAPVLRRTCNEYAVQKIWKHSTAMAMIVPAWKYRLLNDKVTPTRMGSDAARVKSGNILSRVEGSSQHFILMTDHYDIVALVPVPWFEEHWDEEDY